MVPSAPKCPQSGKRSNTVYIIQITCVSVLLTFLGASLTLVLGAPESANEYLEFAGRVVLCLGAAGGVAAPAKKLGDAWHAQGGDNAPISVENGDTPTAPEKQCSNCGAIQS